jgi:hypothetical protein
MVSWELLSMPIIRLINTTTPLRVDDALEGEFFRIINPAFKAAIEKQSRDPYVDVQFVGRDDTDLAPDDTHQRDVIPDTDFLGIYICHNRSSHNPIIKVCPERILDACLRWNQEMDGALACAERYPTLLHKVIIHELAHALMDGRTCRFHAWSPTKFLQELRDKAANDLPDEFKNAPLPDSDCEEFIRRNIVSHARQCKAKATTGPSKDWITADSTILPLRQQQKVVEESLANAFALKQAFGDRQMAALRVFIGSQSAPYKAGLRWQSDIGQLLDTALSWRCFKGDDLWLGDCKVIKRMSEQSRQREGLERLAQRLENPQEAIVSIDFQKGA